MDSTQQIKNILSSSQSLPFFFVGSGLSKRYLSTKNWAGLLRFFSEKIDPSDYSYEKYERKALQILRDQRKEVTKNNLMTKIADLIEIDFNYMWFESDVFKESREKYRTEIKKQGISPYKLEVSNYFNQFNLKNIPKRFTEEIELLKVIGNKSIAGLITTNYDSLLESIFPDYTVYVGQEELIFSQTLGISEIYKIHGCCTKPNSIVINSDDYEAFNNRNAYLAAKLMTIFVEHPIIFIGYSLEDENIQNVIKSIVDCLSEENLVKIKNRLLFVEWEQGKTKMEVITHSRDFGQGKVINMTKITTDSYEDLFKTISENKAKYSTRFFRKLKKDIYELALTSEASEKILVMPLDEERMDNNEDPEVVIGFGIFEFGKQGYQGITAEQIFLDVVFDRYNFNTNLIVEQTLPSVCKQVAWSLPVFKYINKYPLELPESLLRFKSYSFEDFVTKTIRKNRERFGFKSIDEVLEREKPT